MVDDAVTTVSRARLPELAQAVDQRAHWDAKVTAQIIAARGEGQSWELIASVLGVSRQAAWDRYAKLADWACDEDPRRILNGSSSTGRFKHPWAVGT